MVRSPSRRAGSGRKAIPEGREWSKGPPGGPGVVRRQSLWARSGREAIPEGREWSGGSPGGLVGTLEGSESPP